MSCIRLLACIVIGVSPSFALAQNLSITDITSKVDEQATSLDAYQALLDDPDPVRARAAIDIMLAEGDDTLRRLAFYAGVQSDDPLMREKALEGYLSGQPVLEVQIQYDLNAPQSYLRNFAKDTGATIDADNTLHGSWKIGAWDSDNSCWLWAGSNDCAVRLDDVGVSVQIKGRWSRMVLNDKMELVGFTNISSKSPSPVIIPITF